MFSTWKSGEGHRFVLNIYLTKTIHHSKPHPIFLDPQFICSDPEDVEKRRKKALRKIRAPEYKTAIGATVAFIWESLLLSKQFIIDPRLRCQSQKQPRANPVFTNGMK